MSEFKSVIESIIEEIPLLKPTKYDYLKLIKNAFRNPDLSEEQQFYILGQVFLYQPEFFMDNINESWERVATNSFSHDYLVNMEKYILRNFCMLPGENIVMEFPGSFSFLAKRPGHEYPVRKNLPLQVPQKPRKHLPFCAESPLLAPDQSWNQDSLQNLEWVS